VGGYHDLYNFLLQTLIMLDIIMQIIEGIKRAKTMHKSYGRPLSIRPLIKSVDWCGIMPLLREILKSFPELQQYKLNSIKKSVSYPGRVDFIKKNL
jgi:hypothetical protein